jgi:hypothetical protein
MRSIVSWLVALASVLTVPGVASAADRDADGWTSRDGDCDDTDANVYPGATELCDDVQQDCSNADWALDHRVATFYPASGGWEDWTADLAAGRSGAPAEVSLDENGSLVICDGKWYVDLVVAGLDVSITGLHGWENTTLSGGGVSAVLEVVEDHAHVVATGLRMIDANGCFGAAVTTMDVVSCVPGGAYGFWKSDIALSLVEDRIEGNRPTNVDRLGIVSVANATLTLDDTTITNNSDVGIHGEDSHVICNGKRSNDAGVWGNANGVFIHSDSPIDPATFVSNGCDFDGDGTTRTPRYDVRVDGMGWYQAYRRFGEDQNFSCDTATWTCVR